MTVPEPLGLTSSAVLDASCRGRGPGTPSGGAATATAAAATAASKEEPATAAAEGGACSATGSNPGGRLREGLRSRW